MLLESALPMAGALQQLTASIAGLRQGFGVSRGEVSSEVPRLRGSEGLWGPRSGSRRGFPSEGHGEDLVSHADALSSCRTEVTILAQTLWAPGQAVAESEPWLRRQCERLGALSRELHCIKGLAWPKRAPGVQGEPSWAGVWTAGEGRGWAGSGGGTRCPCPCSTKPPSIPPSHLLQRLRPRPPQVPCFPRRPCVGPRSWPLLEDQAASWDRPEAGRWAEWLLQGAGQPRGAAEWELQLKGLVGQGQMLHPPLPRLLVTAGVVGGGVGPWGACQGQPPPEVPRERSGGVWMSTVNLLSVARNAGARAWAGLCSCALHRAPCPGALPAAGWALAGSHNTASSLLRAVTASDSSGSWYRAIGALVRGGSTASPSSHRGHVSPPTCPTAAAHPGLGDVASCKGGLGCGVW